MANTRSLVIAAAHDIRTSWKALALADAAYKILAIVVLTPILGILFRTLIALSGRSVLADQDILFFFLGPVGWVCFVVVGALWLAIVALGQSALLGILAAGSQHHHIRTLEALRLARTVAWPVVQVTARLSAWTLLAIAPFLAGVGVLYLTLLTEFDINFYLSARPPVFLVAAGVAGVLLAAMLALLLHLFTGWFYALPLVVFEHVPPRDALRLSGQRADGHRRTILLWIVGWFLASTVVSALATGAVVGLGRLFVPYATGSLAVLTAAVGLALTLWALVNLALNLLSTTAFAAILFNLYRSLAAPDDLEWSQINPGHENDSQVGFKLTRARLLATCVVAVVVALAVGTVTVTSVRMEDNTQITAHRGSSAAAPENTMAAILRAIEDGADWIEIDVQETADGQVVVFHDSDFMRLSRVNLNIWDATIEDLRTLDVGSWFAPQFADERVPTLAEVLDACKGKAGVNIELKYYGHEVQLEQRVAEIVDECDMADQIVIMSLKVDAVAKMKSLRPDWQVGLLMSVSAGNLRSINADFLAVNASFGNRSFIRSAHASGRQVHVWTVNDAPTMSTMIGRGVDSLITDHPALARSVLDQRATMSAPERLLLELAGMFGVPSQIAQQ